MDAGGPAAGLVSVEWCGANVVSSFSWHCTATEPADGWATADFQLDESWDTASHGAKTLFFPGNFYGKTDPFFVPAGGRNGVPPWGHLDGMNVPKSPSGYSVPAWIWTDDFQGTDEVWCRHIYDPSAPPDTSGIGLGNGGWGQGHICADDSFILYINGDEVVSSTNWQDTQSFFFPDDTTPELSNRIPCDQDNVYAIKGTNGGGGAGIIGDITHCGREIATIPGEKRPRFLNFLVKNDDSSRQARDKCKESH